MPTRRFVTFPVHSSENPGDHQPVLAAQGRVRLVLPPVGRPDLHLPEHGQSASIRFTIMPGNFGF